jgi:hypothetical protein
MRQAECHLSRCRFEPDRATGVHANSEVSGAECPGARRQRHSRSNPYLGAGAGILDLGDCLVRLPGPLL